MQRPDFENVKALVNVNSAYINVQPGGRWTALHQAAFFGNVDMVNWLLARGADKTLVTNCGKTPLQIAYGHNGQQQHMPELA